MRFPWSTLETYLGAQLPGFGGQKKPTSWQASELLLVPSLLFFGFSGCKVCITGKIVVVINSQYHESTTAAFLYIKGMQNPQLGNSQSLQQDAS